MEISTLWRMDVNLFAHDVKSLTIAVPLYAVTSNMNVGKVLCSHVRIAIILVKEEII